MSSDYGTGSLLYPLTQFYMSNGRPLPQAELIDDKLLPQPYRSLLVHNREMTTTLEEYSGSAIHLRVLEARHTPEALFRQVVLMGEGQEKPIEFGAIHINLQRFEDDARRQILDGHIPLGAILRRYNIAHASRPTAFFVMDQGILICQVLGLKHPQRLYGRKNVIRNDRGEVLAEVVEILPPLREAGHV